MAYPGTCTYMDLSLHGLSWDLCLHGLSRDLSLHGLSRDLCLHGLSRDMSLHGLSRDLCLPYPGTCPYMAYPGTCPYMAYPGACAYMAYPGTCPYMAYPGTCPYMVYPGTTWLIPGPVTIWFIPGPVPTWLSLRLLCDCLSTPVVKIKIMQMPISVSSVLLHNPEPLLSTSEHTLLRNPLTNSPSKYILQVGSNKNGYINHCKVGPWNIVCIFLCMKMASQWRFQMQIYFLEMFAQIKTLDHGLSTPISFILELL